MGELKKIMNGDYSNEFKYAQKMGRYGLTKMPPLIITCAITGAIHGAEVNPNLPETKEAQVQSTYDAYNAGASMVHIHARNPKNLAFNTSDVNDYKQTVHIEFSLYFLLSTIGSLLILFRNNLSYFTSIIIANSLMVIGSILLTIGIRKIYKRKKTTLLYLIPFTMFFILMIYYTYYDF